MCHVVYQYYHSYHSSDYYKNIAHFVLYNHLVLMTLTLSPSRYVALKGSKFAYYDNKEVLCTCNMSHMFVM